MGSSINSGSFSQGGVSESNWLVSSAGPSCSNSRSVCVGGQAYRESRRISGKFRSMVISKKGPDVESPRSACSELLSIKLALSTKIVTLLSRCWILPSTNKATPRLTICWHCSQVLGKKTRSISPNVSESVTKAIIWPFLVRVGCSRFTTPPTVTLAFSSVSTRAFELWLILFSTWRK